VADQPADESPDAPEAPPEPLPERFGFPLSASRGQDVLHPGRDDLAGLALALRDEHGFGVCLDVTAVDYLTFEAPRHLPEGVEPERFELVVVVLSLTARERLRLRVQVPADDPVVPSLFDVYPTAEALERETYDMFGIVFEGHPDLTRILMPEDWEGYPLRKQYPTGTIPVQFKGVSNVR
jgi:NADH-quinone oxidoreductase subunit C